MQIFPTIDGAINRFDRVFFGLAGLFVGSWPGAAQMTKSIPNPSGTPALRATLPGWAMELKVYLDRELSAIHRELDRLYSVKQDE